MVRKKFTKKRYNLKKNISKNKKLIGGANNAAAAPAPEPAPALEPVPTYEYLNTLNINDGTSEGLNTNTKTKTKLKFTNPLSVAVSPVDNKIYVNVQDSTTKTYIHNIRVFDGTTLNYIYTLGTEGSAGSGDNEFNRPMGIAVSSDNKIYIADSHNHRVQVYDGYTRNYIATLGTTNESGISEKHFNEPCAVAVSDNKIYVADTSNDRVQIFDRNNYSYIATLGTTGSFGLSNNQFNHPIDIAVSADETHIYVADMMSKRIQIFDGNTYNYISSIVYKSKNKFPRAIAVSADKLIYVINNSKNGVLVYDGNVYRKIHKNNGTEKRVYAPKYITSIGSKSSNDKNKNNTHFNSPLSVAISILDNETRIYVADAQNNRVQIFKKN